MAAVWNAPFWARMILLVAAGLVTLGGGVPFGRSAPFVLGLLVLPVIAGTAVALLHLRHFPLALGVAWAPLPGLLVAAAAAAHFGLVPFSLMGLMLGWILGAAVAHSVASEIVLHAVEGSQARDAVRLAWSTAAAAATAAILAGMAMIAAIWLLAGPNGACVMALAGAGGFSALLAMPLAASCLSFDEDFVARANRLRERRERLFDPLLSVARPRWGFAASGIALVFAVLAGFGLRDAAWHFGPLYPWPIAFLVVAGASAAVIRDWRGASAAVLAMTLAAMMGLWIMVHVGARDPFAIALALAAGLVPVLTLAGRAGGYFRGGDDATIALARLLTRDAPSGAFAALLMTLAAACSVFAAREAAGIVAVFVFAGLAALVFQPALTVVVETLVPRKSTLEARYRVH